MPKSSHLRLRDHRAIVELTHACRDLGDDPIGWRRHLLAELGGLTGAGVGVEYEWPVGPFRPDAAVDWGWGNGFDRASWDRMNAVFAARGVEFNPMWTGYQAAVAAGAGPTLSRADVIRDHAWYLSEYYRLYHRPSGADAMLYSTGRLPGGNRVFGFVFVRASRDRDFSAREKLLIGEVAGAISALVGGPLARFDEPSASGLPPRVRDVLRCLLEGDSDKQAAARLGISRHTVNEYTKHLYRWYGVQGRAELLARWVRRGWGAGRTGA